MLKDQFLLEIISRIYLSQYKVHYSTGGGSKIGYTAPRRTVCTDVIADGPL